MTMSNLLDQLKSMIEYLEKQRAEAIEKVGPAAQNCKIGFIRNTN